MPTLKEVVRKRAHEQLNEAYAGEPHLFNNDAKLQSVIEASLTIGEDVQWVRSIVLLDAAQVMEQQVCSPPSCVDPFLCGGPMLS